MPEQDPFDYTSVDPIDPSFTDPTTSLLQKMGIQNDERQKREKDSFDIYKKQIEYDPKQRANDYFNEMFKSRYGFTPDHGVKKVAGHIIDSIMTFAGVPVFGGIQSQADQKGRKDYEDMAAAYKGLSGADVAQGRADNQAIMAQLMGGINKQKVINQQGQFEQNLGLKRETLKSTNDLKSRALDNQEEGLRLKQELQNINGLKTMAEVDSIMGRTKDSERVRQAIANYDAQVTDPSLKYDVISKAKPEQLKIMMATGQIPLETAQKYLDIGKDMANFKESGGGGTIIKNGDITTDSLGNQHQAPSVREKIQGPPYQPRFMTPGEKPTLQGTPQNIAKLVTTAGAIPSKPIQETGDPATDAQSYWNLAKKSPEYSTMVGNAPGTGKSQRDEVAKLRQWKDTNSLLEQNMDNIGTQIASGKSGWRNAFSQNPIIKGLRTATGQLSGSEVLNDANSIFAVAAHLRQKFGTGRPSYELTKAIEQGVNNKNDTDEEFFRRQASVYLLADLSRLTMQSPHYEHAIDKLREAGGNGVKGSTWAEAVNQVIDESYKSAKAGTYIRPTIERVFNRVQQNIAKGSSNKPLSYKDRLKAMGQEDNQED